MRFQKGQKIRIRLRNGLPSDHRPLARPACADADGRPSDVCDRPRRGLCLQFEIRNRAGLYFYHPHTHEATATQVYRGMAGAIIVNDDEEKALELPSGEFEIPIVLQDRSFKRRQPARLWRRHARPDGRFSGRSCSRQRTARLRHRRGEPRLSAADLNGSNSRIYKLAWDDASPITVIGVDGGLLEKPEEKPYVMLAPANGWMYGPILAGEASAQRSSCAARRFPARRRGWRGA